MVPFTGLGLYGGFRGNRWLKNRIHIFKQFVVPSLLAQTDQDFVLWVCWRYEEKSNPQVQELYRYLNRQFTTVFTYSGIPFWDDKYDDQTARERLSMSIHGAMPDLMPYIQEKDVLMTIQPSDDVYRVDAVAEAKKFFKKNPSYNVYGYKSGFVADYNSLELKTWNPTTTPPFYTIKFKNENFIDPQ